MKGKINKIDAENIGEHYGIDVESELTSMLSDELAKSIDDEIMKKLFSDNKLDKINRIIEKIKIKDE